MSEGTELPDFDLVDDRGGRVRRDDILGTWTVLWWYVMADTPG